MWSSWRLRLLWAAAACALVLSCARRREPARGPEPHADSTTARAIERDRPERLVLPLAPPGAGRVAYVGVAPARAALDLPPPPADVAAPPASGAPATPALPESAASELKPPIPRGRPRTVSGGRGGRVTLDVRVDEGGEVSDVELVETDADSLTVLAATLAARAQRYYPAILGERHVAVWTRQVFELTRGRERQP
jgi:outer membrane biosynthesis protein TonB